MPKPRSRSRTRPKLINADKSYDSVAFRQYLRTRGIHANIPERDTPVGKKRRKKGRKPKLKKESYKNRNQIERLFGKLKQYRRVATRYDKYAMTFQAFISLGIVLIATKTYFSNST